MSDLISGLNVEQQLAVLSESKRILMLAGAGTGKTRTLTHRLAHLNLNCRVGSSSMIAITFTRAAAKEMKDRLGPLIGEKEAKKLNCSTFHSLAVRILKEWGQRLGLDKQFSIYTREDREEIVKAIIVQLRLSSQTSLSKVVEQMGRANPREPEASVLREYGWQLKRYNAVDLDHLIKKVNELFVRHADVADYYRRQWKYVFVDETQDTNSEQFTFIKLLNPENLFVVGDDFQTIYSFAGARVENILEFPQEFPGTETIKLEQNYRSTRPIIETANTLIKHNLNQTEKTLIAHKDGNPFDIFMLSDQESEANIIAGLIEHQTLGGKFSDYAVLARTNAQVEFVYYKLRAKGIPCIMLGGSDDPLKKNVVRSLISYLVSIFNPKDENNFKRAMNFPEPVMTDMQMKQVEQIATERSLSLKDAMSSDQYFSKFLISYTFALMEVMNASTAIEAFQAVVKSLDLRDRYTERSLNNRIQDLDEAEKYISYWMERQQKLGESVDAPTFLKWAAMRDIQEKLMDDRDAVKLMTIHGSKGLEFPTVFLIGMNEGTFPSKNTRDMEEERRLAYVAVTRAKDNLVISSTRTASSWGKTEECNPSRFIKEMGGITSEILLGVQESSSR